MSDRLRRKGIILAGGEGTRLWPMTAATSKQLLPIYDKPLIYYPISTLMLTGVQEILIITNQQYLSSFKALLGDGSQWGLHFDYAVQQKPNGIAEGLIIAEKFLCGAPSVMILGDNLFYGNGLINKLSLANAKVTGSTMFVVKSSKPELFGVVEIGQQQKVLSIEEKPKTPKSNLIATGLYFFDEKAPSFAKKISKSWRNELEITDVLELYRTFSDLNFVKLERGFAWFDTGTVDNLLAAANFVQTIQENSSQMIGCLEEIAYRRNWISDEVMVDAISRLSKSNMGEYLNDLMNTHDGSKLN